MDEIKYKAWIEEERRRGDRIFREGKMVQVTSLRMDGLITYPYQTDKHGTQRETYPKALLKFTGRKDINNKDIYEGYIVKFTVESEQDGFEGVEEVKWDDRVAGFWPFVREACWRTDVKNVEIIGDIYQNPELLEEI